MRHTGSVTRPRSHVATPQRATLRYLMHGAIVSDLDRPDFLAPLCRAGIVVFAVVVAGLSAKYGWHW